MSSAKDKVKEILAKADITLNGSNPWDIHVHNEDFYARAIAQGSLGIGEAYMDGWWDCNDLAEFFARVTSSDLGKHVAFTVPNVVLFLKSTLQNRQNKKRAMKVGEIHYDLPVEVWEATLDTTLTGSCAYYQTGEETLEEAQEAKKKLIFNKLDLKHGQTMLDIGVGWGAFSGYAAEHYGAHPIGITISPVQRDFIHKRYGPSMIDVRVHDYRDTILAEPVDRIISVEMFEQVGIKNLRTFFEIARRSLRGDGRFLLHTIVTHKPSPHIDPWMNKYIYPEGYLPTLGQIGTAVHGLFHVEDVQDIGAHYDPTLVAWMKKFRANRENVKALGRDKLGMDPEMFCRMWEYHYLASAGGFRSRMISVHQYLLSPNGILGGYQSVR